MIYYVDINTWHSGQCNSMIQYRVSEKKNVQQKSAFVWYKLKNNCKWNIRHQWSLGFWMPFISANLDVAIQRYREGTNCATFRWIGQNNAQLLLVGAYWSCWLDWIHSSHNAVTFRAQSFSSFLFVCFFVCFIKHIK